MFKHLYGRLRRITTNHLYFPEIDGIRFFAISIVILFHIHGYFIEKSGNIYNNVDSLGWLQRLFYNGSRGVELFFALSGFILCLPFAHQYLNNGKVVGLKRYYLRRVTRLEPPYFIAMIVLFTAMVVIKVHSLSVLTSSLLASLVYAHNILFQHSSYINVVTWSLEIEIQFYLLAPLIFKVLTLAPLLRRTLLIFAILAFVSAQHFYTLPFLSIYGFIQYFLAGILLADLYVSGEGATFVDNKLIKYFGLLLVAVVIYLPIKKNLAGQYAFPLLIVLLYLIILKNNYIKRLFSYKFIPIIGGMCYSIYLLHYPIISMAGRITTHIKIGNNFMVNLLTQMAILSAIILIISSAFYYMVEQPFMASKWTDKLMKRKATQE